MIAHSIAEVEAETAAAEAARSEVDEGWDEQEPPTTTLQPEDLPILAAAPPPVAPPAAPERDPDREQTRNERRPSAPVAAQVPAVAMADALPRAASETAPGDDAYGPTVIAPPVFVD